MVAFYRVFRWWVQNSVMHISRLLFADNTLIFSSLTMYFLSLFQIPAKNSGRFFLQSDGGWQRYCRHLHTSYLFHECFSSMCFQSFFGFNGPQLQFTYKNELYLHIFLIKVASFCCLHQHHVPNHNFPFLFRSVVCLNSTSCFRWI